MSKELIVLLAEREIGRVTQDQRGKLKFTYDDSWRNTPGAYPLSLSMPLAASEHDHALIDAFIWGLLPDNENVLSKWAQKFQVSARNAFALISHVGEDCAGAVRFVLPDRLDEVREHNQDAVEWISEDDVAQRLAALRADHAAWRNPRDTGQFSLAGAQPKTALLFQDGKWGVPSGRVPTTHILKPPTGALDGHAENEHFCLDLAGELGLPTASSQVMLFNAEIAIVVERYDRQQTASGLVRVHQEDMCQALGLPPTQKYENDQGPGIQPIVELLRQVSGAAQQDVSTFLGAIAFNWLIGGTDAHAKNYSVLIGAGGRARLAPLYDLGSILPYDEHDFQKLKLAMKLGGEYKLRDITKRQWQKLAADVKVDEDVLFPQVQIMARAMPDAASTVQKRLTKEGLTHPIVPRITERITERAKKFADF